MVGDSFRIKSFRLYWRMLGRLYHLALPITIVLRSKASERCYIPRICRLLERFTNLPLKLQGGCTHLLIQLIQWLLVLLLGLYNPSLLLLLTRSKYASK